MKKTLIALVLTATAVSGSAMAWTANGTGGSMEFGGTIAVTKVPQWLVQMGAGDSSFSSVDSDLTGENKELTITSNKAIPFIQVKSKEAYSGLNYSLGTMPAFAISGGDDVTITRSWVNNKLSFSVPVYINGGVDKAGAVTFEDVAVGGLMYGGKVNSSSDGIALVVSDNHRVPASLFAGAVGGSSEALDVTNTEGQFNQLGLGSLISEAKALVGATYTTWTDQGWLQSIATNTAVEKFNNESMDKGAAIFSMGVQSGGAIKLAFTQAVKQNTTWKAPIKITVNYQ
ncbi:F4 family fimbrial subunit [Citrobacter portucalensis]|uniref:F4 family fimbrial subunit n=1 Tax=Citrobacter portucalensis TaxID=1639133 RepID=UPI00288B83EF|nr:hypothetical protein [Citrobacter portucalensis]WNI88069.1 hypothetical protein RIK60_10035 [Citrobacter portucalensis]